MIFPYLSASTAGVLLILQMVLAATVSGARGKANTWVGDAGHAALLRTSRRHANLAENAGLFVAGLSLLELSNRYPTLLLVLCIAFVAVRVAHAIGLSQENTNNPYRLLGGVGTYLTGLTLGAVLVWVGAHSYLTAHAAA